MSFRFEEKNNVLFIYNELQNIAVIQGNQSKDNKGAYFLSNQGKDKQLNIVAIDLLQMPINEYPNNLRLMIHEYNDFLSGFLYIEPKKHHLKITMQFEHDVSKWNNPFTIDELNKSLCDRLAEMNYVADDEEYFRIDVIFEISIQESTTLAELIQNHSNKVKKIIEEEKVRLANINFEETFIKIFNFPDEYKNIYSQYLMWFGEFLKNLGINVNVTTQNNQGQTSLIVSPKDAPELLDEIEKQFYLYLQLPYVEVLPPQREMSIQEQHTFMAIRQQIQMLEMQVETKDSLLLNHNSTIASLNTTVARQADLIETQADKLTLVNALVDKDKWTKVPFTEGTFKCKNFGKKTMSIQFEPLAVFNKLVNKKDESSKEDE